MNQSNTIERCLEIPAGYDEVYPIDPKQLKSVTLQFNTKFRQTSIKKSSTDRQYDLAVVKCNDYYDILFEFGIDKTVFENYVCPQEKLIW